MFPMNQRAEDLMMSAPSEPMAEQLMELGLRVIPQHQKSPDTLLKTARAWSISGPFFIAMRNSA
jgi:hypothetical protein